MAEPVTMTTGGRAAIVCLVVAAALAAGVGLTLYGNHSCSQWQDRWREVGGMSSGYGSDTIYPLLEDQPEDCDPQNHEITYRFWKAAWEGSKL